MALNFLASGASGKSTALAPRKQQHQQANSAPQHASSFSGNMLHESESPSIQQQRHGSLVALNSTPSKAVVPVPNYSIDGSSRVNALRSMVQLRSGISGVSTLSGNSTSVVTGTDDPAQDHSNDKKKRYHRAPPRVLPLLAPSPDLLNKPSAQPLTELLTSAPRSQLKEMGNEGRVFGRNVRSSPLLRDYSSPSSSDGEDSDFSDLSSSVSDGERRHVSPFRATNETVFAELIPRTAPTVGNIQRTRKRKEKKIRRALGLEKFDYQEVASGPNAMTKRRDEEIHRREQVKLKKMQRELVKYLQMEGANVKLAKFKKKRGKGVKRSSRSSSEDEYTTATSSSGENEEQEDRPIEFVESEVDSQDMDDSFRDRRAGQKLEKEAKLAAAIEKKIKAPKTGLEDLSTLSSYTATNDIERGHSEDQVRLKADEVERALKLSGVSFFNQNDLQRFCFQQRHQKYIHALLRLRASSKERSVEGAIERLQTLQSKRPEKQSAGIVVASSTSTTKEDKMRKRKAQVTSQSVSDDTINRESPDQKKKLFIKTSVTPIASTPEPKSSASSFLDGAKLPAISKNTSGAQTPEPTKSKSQVLMTLLNTAPSLSPSNVDVSGTSGQSLARKGRLKAAKTFPSSPKNIPPSSPLVKRSNPDHESRSELASRTIKDSKAFADIPEVEQERKKVRATPGKLHKLNTASKAKKSTADPGEPTFGDDNHQKESTDEAAEPFFLATKAEKRSRNRTKHLHPDEERKDTAGGDDASQKGDPTATDSAKPDSDIPPPSKQDDSTDAAIESGNKETARLEQTIPDRIKSSKLLKSPSKNSTSALRRKSPVSKQPNSVAQDEGQIQPGADFTPKITKESRKAAVDRLMKGELMSAVVPESVVATETSLVEQNETSEAENGNPFSVGRIKKSQKTGDTKDEDATKKPGEDDQKRKKVHIFDPKLSTDDRKSSSLKKTKSMSPVKPSKHGKKKKSSATGPESLSHIDETEDVAAEGEIEVEDVKIDVPQYSGVTASDVITRSRLSLGCPQMPELPIAPIDPDVPCKLTAVVVSLDYYSDDKILPCPKQTKNDAEAVSLMLQVMGYRVYRLNGNKGKPVTKETVVGTIKHALQESGKGSTLLEVATEQAGTTKEGQDLLTEEEIKELKIKEAREAEEAKKKPKAKVDTGRIVAIPDGVCLIYIAGRGIEGTLHGYDTPVHYLPHCESRLTQMNRHNTIILEELVQLKSSNGVRPVIYCEMLPFQVQLKGAQHVGQGMGIVLAGRKLPGTDMVIHYPNRVNTGAFTWYFLKGLQGDAVRSSQVTTSALNVFIRDSLQNRFLKTMSEGSKEPTIQIRRTVDMCFVGETANYVRDSKAAGAIASKENMMFKYKAELTAKKKAKVATPCRFVVDVNVDIRYLKDKDSFVRRFLKRANDLFYKPGKFYSTSKARCMKLLQVFRTGEYTLQLDMNQMKDNMHHVIAEGSYDDEMEDLTGCSCAHEANEGNFPVQYRLYNSSGTMLVRTAPKNGPQLNISKELYKRFYVENRFRIAEYNIVSVKEKVQFYFAGCERDFLQFVKHGSLGSFCNPALMMCDITYVTYQQLIAQHLFKRKVRTLKEEKEQISDQVDGEPGSSSPTPETKSSVTPPASPAAKSTKSANKFALADSLGEGLNFDASLSSTTVGSLSSPSATKKQQQQQQTSMLAQFRAMTGAMAMVSKRKEVESVFLRISAVQARWRAYMVRRAINPRRNGARLILQLRDRKVVEVEEKTRVDMKTLEMKERRGVLEFTTEAMVRERHYIDEGEQWSSMMELAMNWYSRRYEPGTREAIEIMEDIAICQIWEGHFRGLLYIRSVQFSRILLGSVKIIATEMTKRARELNIEVSDRAKLKSAKDQDHLAIRRKLEKAKKEAAKQQQLQKR